MKQEKIWKLVNEYSSPMYVFDIATLVERVKKLRFILGKEVSLCYAMKANPMLISYLDNIVDRFEVCSQGEYEICMMEKVNSKKIVFSGINKDIVDIRRMRKEGFEGVYTIESLCQLQYLQETYIDPCNKPKYMIRLTNGSQFGIDKEAIRELFAKNITKSFGNFVGIQFFSGTQKKKRNEIREEVLELIKFCKELNRDFDANINMIEYGPGLYIDYFSHNEEDGFEEAEELSKILNEYKAEFKFIIELGRYVAATCGTYLTKVIDVKKNNGINYAIVDGGIHQITYYGQMVGVKVPPIKQISQNSTTDFDISEKWNICGSLCTMKDVLLRGYEGNVSVGDVFAFEKCGAYSVTEGGYLFLSRNLPLILALEINGNIKMIRDAYPTYNLNGRFCQG